MPSRRYYFLDDLCRSAILDRGTAEEILRSTNIPFSFRASRIALTERAARKLLTLLKQAAKTRRDKRRPMMALPDLVCVYFIADGEFVKIGAAVDARKRMADLQVANPRPLKLLFVLDGGYAEEDRLHVRFSDYHERGDWFRIEGALAAFIEVQIGERDMKCHESPTHSRLETFYADAISQVYPGKTST